MHSAYDELIISEHDDFLPNIIRATDLVVMAGNGLDYFLRPNARFVPGGWVGWLLSWELNVWCIGISTFVTLKAVGLQILRRVSGSS